MILYNVTCLVEEQIVEEWIQWMKDEHLPEVMATQKFTTCRIFRIDPHQDGDSGVSFSIQYTAETRADYADYAENHGPALKAKTEAKYGERLHAFRTLMEEL
jgi:Domain of unknown function (DUF4286)